MAFLKETERSLRAYFILAGVLATLLALVALGGAGKNPASTRSMLVTLAIWFPPLARLVLGPAFVIAGINLKRALESGAVGTRQLVKIAGAVVVLEVVLLAAAVSGTGKAAELTGEAVGGAVIPLLLLWYISASLRRLAEESQRRVVETVAGKFV